MRIPALVLMLLALGGCGVTASPFNPGFADFSRPKLEGVHRDTALSIGPRLLSIAANHADEGPEIEALLRELEGVQVQVYELDGNADFEAISADLQRQSRETLDDDWQHAIAVREANSRVNIFIKERDELILGLAIIVLEENELVIVNVMGEVTAQTIAGLSDSGSDTELLASLVAMP